MACIIGLECDYSADFMVVCRYKADIVVSTMVGGSEQLIIPAGGH